jgi:hypothetical protein
MKMGIRVNIIEINKTRAARNKKREREMETILLGVIIYLLIEDEAGQRREKTDEEKTCECLEWFL